jgi:hypothetical protein
MRCSPVAASDRESAPSIGRLTHLPREVVRTLHGRRGQALAVFTGRVWLTRPGERRDIVLAAGETFAFDRDSELVVQALADAYIVLFDLAVDAGREAALWQPEPGAGHRA